MMKELDFNLKESPFYEFFSSRYSISARVDVKDSWDFCKNNNKSFYIISLGCLLFALNDIPQLRRRIVNDKAVEYDKIDAISPIMNKEQTIFKEMRVSPLKENESLKEWYYKVVELKDSILTNKVPGFSIDIMERDSEAIANFSAIPWVDFDTMTNCLAEPHQTQPLITWGKVSKDKKMSVSITVNHIFVYGNHLGQYFNKLQEYFNNIPDIF